ncbi:hypothetical protein V6N12_005706 [Hibiscus sabdariffa]|uniref:Uncharacterized protein n=1 Tax=Hibiscus sabdariffa TaxID=183260 RepID=A0ABR1ZQW3_9ROSI
MHRWFIWLHCTTQNSASLSKISHPSSDSALPSPLILSSEDLLFGDCPSTDGVGLLFSGVLAVSHCPELSSDVALFRDEPEEARMQLVWLEDIDLLNGIRSSNFCFSTLISSQITDISPLQKGQNENVNHSSFAILFLSQTTNQR